MFELATLGIETAVMPALQQAWYESPSNWAWFTGGSLLFGVIAYFVGNTKGHGCLGCILGLLLGPLGLIITALLGSSRRY